MKTIVTTSRYNTAFWNLQCGNTYDLSDLNNARSEATAGHYLPNESDAKFKAEQ